MVILFHGSPGTGKTMTAHAVANHLGKRILTLALSAISENTVQEVLRQVFREAVIQDAILFFDECEPLFRSRDRAGSAVNSALSEVERFDGLLLLATNRPFELDQAMHRRITIAMEFEQPDASLRERIWRSHVVSGIKLSEDVDLTQIAHRFELSGGYIKNSLLAATSAAVSRAVEDGETDDDQIVVHQSDLITACQHQVRSHLEAFDQKKRQLIPQHGLESLVCSASVLEVLHEILQVERARHTLTSQWGFNKTEFSSGTSVLLMGPRGSGKRKLAEAVSFELARPLRILSCLEVLASHRTTRGGVSAWFEDAATSHTVLLLQGCESLFATSKLSEAAQVLLHNAEHSEAFCIMACLPQPAPNQRGIPPHRLKYELLLTDPDRDARERLWRLMIPADCPTAADLDLEALAERYRLQGASIKSAVVRAASRAALRTGSDKLVRMADLEEGAQIEIERLERSDTMNQAATMFL
eukprot:TRINITY_DN9343_c0_g2_i1.p1 TRINITY_DN9343_c0_g2~~TRINITY_DN9343_c0_g2_i1.p1  ORF type:complete len:472 (+),score=97.22 TRINITY_DN9343_c0_g2_i1:413-1828(+)